MYNSQEIAGRIKLQAKKSGKSLAVVLSECGLGKNTVSKISNGTDILTLNFAKIADNLGCSVDYLLGRNEQKEEPTPVSENGPNKQDEMDRQLMSYVNRMTPEQKAFFLLLLQTAAAQGQEMPVPGQLSIGETVPEFERSSRT